MTRCVSRRLLGLIKTNYYVNGIKQKIQTSNQTYLQLNDPQRSKLKRQPAKKSRTLRTMSLLKMDRKLNPNRVFYELLINQIDMCLSPWATNYNYLRFLPEFNDPKSSNAELSQLEITVILLPTRTS